MALFTFSASVLNSAKIIPPGWYPVEVAEYRTSKSTNDPNNNVYFFTLNVLDGEYKDCVITGIFNDKMPDPLVKLATACVGEIEPGAQMDFNSLIGSQIDAYSKPETYDGKTSNKASDFRKIA